MSPTCGCTIPLRVLLKAAQREWQHVLGVRGAGDHPHALVHVVMVAAGSDDAHQMAAAQSSSVQQARR